MLKPNLTIQSINVNDIQDRILLKLSKLTIRHLPITPHDPSNFNGTILTKETVLYI